MAVTVILGHSTVTITQEIYQQPTLKVGVRR